MKLRGLHSHKCSVAFSQKFLYLHCWQAEELVRRRLEVTPDDARLLCTLGDLTLDDKYYLEAWERSGHRSAR